MVPEHENGVQTHDALGFWRVAKVPIPKNIMDLVKSFSRAGDVDVIQRNNEYSHMLPGVALPMRCVRREEGGHQRVALLSTSP